MSMSERTPSQKYCLRLCLAQARPVSTTYQVIPPRVKNHRNQEAETPRAQGLQENMNGGFSTAILSTPGSSLMYKRRIRLRLHKL